MDSIDQKKHANTQLVSATEAVTEAIRYGLIDTRTKSLNQQKYPMLFQKKENWKQLDSKKSSNTGKIFRKEEDDLKGEPKQ